MSLASSFTLGCPSTVSSSAGSTHAMTSESSTSVFVRSRGPSTEAASLTPDPSARAIRASPFEPLVVDRRLPPGKISPLQVEEYMAWKESQDHPPPISEVRIPLNKVAEQGLVELSSDHWKTLYFNTLTKLKQARDQSSSVQDENRLLKRRLIQMQKSLFEARRNQRHGQVQPWTIPLSAANRARRSVAERPVPVPHAVSQDEALRETTSSK